VKPKTKTHTGSSFHATYPPDWFLRLSGYIKRHGFRRTLGQTASVIFRGVLENRKILYYCDVRTRSVARLADDLIVERRESQEDIAERDWDQIATVMNVKLARRNYAKRFSAGASMWLVRSQGNFAGYGWTLPGGTIEPHYYLLGKEDVHLFDFMIFPEYRGRHINSSLVNYILCQLAAEGKSRAFIETSEWNHSEIRSLCRTSFLRMGMARKLVLLGRVFVLWGK
jgi:ribosomal protein S18 acetylase RimI-like enzyme